VCQSGWDWASNSLGQNPCAIAGALEAPCRGLASYTLGPLNNTNYVAPPKGSALDCECNTIMYSLFMACTACQGETTQRWTFWSQYCGAVYVTQYPDDIPGGTAVPHWAYLNVTGSDMWDPAAARVVVGDPESTATKPPVSTIGTSTSHTSTKTGTSSTRTPTNSTTGSNSNSGGVKGGGSNAGAIAGGVVGGLAGLGLIAAVVVWFIMKKKRGATAASNALNNGAYPDPNSYPKYEHAAPISPGPMSPPQMLYNPSDPSTFPTAVQDPSFGGGSSGYPQTSYDPQAQYRGHYSGAPEV